MLSIILNECGHKVYPVQSGKVALKIIQNENPDLILLDINMTEVNGYEICKQLKDDENFTNVPVIFISSTKEEIDFVRAFNVGGSDYLTKPFQFEEVKSRIGTHLQLRNLLSKKNEYEAKENIINERDQKLLMDKLQIGLLIFDNYTQLIFYNDKALQLIGFSGDQFFERFLTEEVIIVNTMDGAGTFKNLVVNKIVNNQIRLENYIIEVNHGDKADKIWLLINAIPEFNAENKLQQIIITMIDISERKKAEGALIQSHEQLKQFASHINTARDEEKVVLARELHDNVAQTLIAVKIDLGLLKQKLSNKDQQINSDETAEYLQHLYILVDNTIKKVRNLITELWP